MPLTAPWEGLFDELAELDEAARVRRLGEIARDNPDVAGFLGELLAADAGERGELPKPLAERAPELVAAALAEAVPPEHDRAGERIGNYRLLSLLGRGGMAEVWLAERADGEFDSRVALKLVRPELESGAILAGFLRERRILARLVHPGIARLLDGGRSGTGEPYFVLEHVDGTPVTDWCAAGEVPLAARLRLMIEVCEAVDHAHRSLVVHRDLKPSNVLVDRSGHPKLLDFGIAKLLSPEPGGVTRLETGELRLGGPAFTPGYASPEQILGEPITTATDVYALGVLLYELLTGEKPFSRAARPLEKLAKEIETETLELPSARLRRIDGTGPARRRAARLEGDLDAVVAKALAREPERRYPGAAALADDLRRYEARRPVRARPASVTHGVRCFVERHRLWVSAAVLVVLSLVGGLAVALWQARVAREEAHRAERARGFLVSMFESLDPVQARGGAVTPQTLLAAGSRQLDRESAEDPAFQAEMLDLLANLHRKLGLLAEGRTLAERSLALRRRLFGPGSAEAAQSLTTLGWIRLNQGEPVAARGLLEQAVADLERTTGGDSLAAADAREPLVEALFAGQSAAKALPVAERRLAAYRRLLGDAHEKTGLTWNDRGVLLQELGRLPEAEADFRQSLAVLGRRLPGDDPRLAYPHQNLGTVLLSRFRTAEAERELRTAYELRRRSLGPRHPETALTLAMLAQVLVDRRQLGPAEAAARQVVDILDGKDLYTAANARCILAQILFEESRHREALAGFDRGIAELETLVSADQPLLLSAHGWRAQVLLALGRKKEGMADLRSAIDGLEKIGTAGDGQRGELLAVLASARRGEGQTAEAWKLHQQVRRLAAQRFGEEHRYVAVADFELALDILAEPGSAREPARRAQAAALLTRSRDRLRRLEPHHEALAGIERRLAELRKP
ncbi:MAG TPA: tetratricopeptide repeat protein [Thermoanaerobaculia bacterium]|nr:tetratricopeptide repeat protein [Thermoanaerobaculia bacterium]